VRCAEWISEAQRRVPAHVGIGQLGSLEREICCPVSNHRRNRQNNHSDDNLHHGGVSGIDVNPGMEYGL